MWPDSDMSMHHHCHIHPDTSAWFPDTLQSPTAIQTTLREKMSCVLAAISSFGGPDAIGFSKVSNAILVPQKWQKQKLTNVLIALTQVLHHSGYLNTGPVNQGTKC